MTTLVDPARFGRITTASRIAMAPLTRDRAGPGRTPTALMASYYAQRASAGLIITEATQISPEGQGYLDTPGLYSPEQIAGWRRATPSRPASTASKCTAPTATCSSSSCATASTTAPTPTADQEKTARRCCSR